jgi:hypothetical protein
MCDPSGCVIERSVPLVLLSERVCELEAALGAALLAENPSHTSVEPVGVRFHEGLEVAVDRVLDAHCASVSSMMLNTPVPGLA